MEERFRAGIIVAIPTLAHAAKQSMLFDQALKSLRTVLAATVAVNDHVSRKTPPKQRHRESITDQRRFHSITHRPSHNLARVQIDDHREVEPP
jgi:hypothetical protein